MNTLLEKYTLFVRAFGLERAPGGNSKHLQKKKKLCAPLKTYHISYQHRIAHICLLPKECFCTSFLEVYNPVCVIPKAVRFHNAKMFA